MVVYLVSARDEMQEETNEFVYFTDIVSGFDRFHVEAQFFQVFFAKYPLQTYERHKICALRELHKHELENWLSSAAPKP